MPRIPIPRFFLAAIAGCLFVLQPALAAAGQGPLVSAQWLQGKLGRDEVLLLDASPASLYAAKHIPGAVSADVFAFGVQKVPLAEIQRRLQSWGVSQGQPIVIYDQGGTMSATRLFFELHYHGVPASALSILDGGLAKWQQTGGAVTQEPTPPRAGTFRIGRLNEDVRVRLPEFLNASGDTAHHTLVEALEPSYHFGETQFFDRAGHVPNAIMWPTGDFYNADKTFKSADEIRRMAGYLGIRPEQQIHSYCGGGVAASVPFFALKFLLGYPNVKLYVESQLEWLQDERGLPLWTYAAPNLLRERGWLQGWSNRMMRAYGVTQISVLDVRPAPAFEQGHVPYALNIPAEQFSSHVAQPGQLAEMLGRSGVNPAHEAVIVSDGGLNERSALAFVMLEKLGQKKVSLLMDSVDEWGLAGLPLTKEATVVGAPRSPQELAVPPTAYSVPPRAGVLISDPAATRGAYPKVFIASGKTLPAKAPAGTVIHLPYTELLDAGGRPKPAKDLWKILTKAGVPRYAEIVCIADDAGAAAVNYVVLKLMGYPDVKLLPG